MMIMKKIKNATRTKINGMSICVIRALSSLSLPSMMMAYILALNSGVSYAEYMNLTIPSDYFVTLATVTS
jgi:hypothetical protein